MATVTHRRKGVTYGKAHRRTFANSGFAPEAASQSIWEARKGKTTSQNIGPFIGSDLNSQSPSPPRASKFRHDPATSRGHRLEVDATYDFLPSEDEISLSHPNTAMQPSLKRRKLTQSEAFGSDLAVFDDRSLQEHIAAEMCGKTAHVRKPPVGSQRRALLAKKETEGPSCQKGEHQSQASKAALAAKRAQKLGRNAKEKPTTFAMRSERKSPNNEAEHPTPMKTVRKSPIGRPSTPTTPPDLCTHESQLPVTPSSSELGPTGGTHESCTTPRQKEMWNRLLGFEQYSESLSQPNVSGPQSAQAAYDSAENAGQKPRRRLSKAAGNTPKLPRLIDLLNVSTSRASWSDPSDPYSESDDITSEDASGGSATVVDRTDQGGMRDPNKDTPSVDGIPSESFRGSSTYVSRGTKVTYAQQRSYLDDETAFSLQPTASKQLQIRSLYQNPAATSQHDIFDAGSIDDDHSNQAAAAMRSVHELREAGGNVRIVGTLESLLDELDDCADNVSVTRSTLMDLASKLLEPLNAQLLVDRGLETRLLDRLSSNADLLTKALMAMLLLELMYHTKSPVLFSRIDEEPVKGFFIGLLYSSQDLKRKVQGREANVPKMASQEYIDLCDRILSSQIWQFRRPSCLSCRVLGLQCLRELAVWKKEGAFTTELLSAQHFQRLVQTSVPPRLLSTQSDQTERFCLHLAIIIIDAAVAGSSSAIEASISDDLLPRITHILPNVSLDEGDASAIQILTLHLYCNMTQGEPAVCETFSQSESIATMFNFSASYFESNCLLTAHNGQAGLNKTILSLLCLMNIAQVSDGMRQRCLLQSKGDTSRVGALVDLYMKHRYRATEVTSEDEIRGNVPFGYLSVLICFLCLNPTARNHVEARMPSQSMKPLLDAVEEFLKYHKVIDKAMNDEGLVNGQPGFVDRVQALLNNLLAC